MAGSEMRTQINSNETVKNVVPCVDTNHARSGTAMDEMSGYQMQRQVGSVLGRLQVADGQGLTEYLLLLGFVAVVALVGVSAVSASVGGLFSHILAAL
jgi:Flp pilus assembly pilin Flp